MTLILWMCFSVMAAAAIAGLTIPLLRRYDADVREEDAVTAVLRDQLADVDAQTASGQVGVHETEGLRTEIKRRLLIENRSPPVPVRLLNGRSAQRGAIVLAASVGLGATALYTVLGRPDLALPMVAPTAQANGSPEDPAATSIAPLVAELEARMKRTPDEPEGWRMLGLLYFQTQRYAEAANAYAKALKLNPKGAGYASAMGEALVQAAGGVVTPAATTAFVEARRLDGSDARARYFLALGRDQAGDHRGAIDDWVTLLREAPVGAPWAPQLRRFVNQAASQAHIDLAGRLPADEPLAQASPPQPSPADVAAVTALPPAAQQAFIRSMVASLAARLKAHPRDVDGWIRLIRARKVLGDVAGARTALREGTAAFADQPKVRETIAAGAANAGVS